MMGVLADRWARKRVMLLIYLIVALAIPLLFLGHYAEARWAFALLFGIGLGGDYMELGLVPGTRVSVTRVAPLGDPLELRLRNYALSIRRAEALSIEVDEPEA